MTITKYTYKVASRLLAEKNTVPLFFRITVTSTAPFICQSVYQQSDTCLFENSILPFSGIQLTECLAFIYFARVNFLLHSIRGKSRM